MLLLLVQYVQEFLLHSMCGRARARPAGVQFGSMQLVLLSRVRRARMVYMYSSIDSKARRPLPAPCRHECLCRQCLC